MGAHAADPRRKPLALLELLRGANEAVPLSTDDTVVEFEGASEHVDAHVVTTLAWHPRPHTRLEITATEPGQGVPARPKSANVTLHGQTVECLVSRLNDVWHHEQGRQLTARLVMRTTTDFGDGHGLRRLGFAAVNLGSFLGQLLKDGHGAWAGHLELVASGWRVVLDQRRDLDDIKAQLENDGGYALTHAGALERIDGAHFDVEAAAPILDALYLLLSFVQGHAVSLVWVTGEQDAGCPCWRRWLVPTVAPWSEPPSWFDPQRPTHLRGIFDTLLQRWTDEGWRKAMQVGVFWYLDALEARSSDDTCIVLAFTGLELVTWFWVVELEEACSSSSFDRCSAADRLSRLLELVGIDPAIPPELGALASYATTQNWKDGPSALARLRHAAVHPRRRSRIYEAPDEARWEASTLGLWYLELALLRLLGYGGTYLNRVRRPGTYGLEWVPWAIPTGEG